MKLSSSVLKKVIREEAAKMGKEKSTEDAAKETEEVEAGDLADTLEKHIDYVKAVKLEEKRMINRLRKLRENKNRSLRTIHKLIKRI